ncbi:uncharacterized protein A4U43_C07F13820 [Asparagus officinalis]|uniref:Uncharacterized protein n=1 Tax=Asparagus officinalis TaxID=4686 RepID=A0A5P1EC15_ASPOF|nr:uncharacterized protein A4U43_C07F13820 [Asparagus officinalis]
MDTCLPPQPSSPFSPPPLPPPTLIFAEDSKCNNILSIGDYVWYDQAIYTEDSSSNYGGKECSVCDHARNDIGSGMNKGRFNAEIRKRNETHKEGETEKRVEVYGDGLLVKDEREKDRIFWETCLASGYP